jgi:hypothetical protein
VTRDQLCSEIAKRENKKVSVPIGNIREVLRILLDLQVEWQIDPDAVISDSPLFILTEEADKLLKAKEKKKKKVKK